MIEACRQAGVEVPHYCYHPKLSSPGNCRMCLVEMGMPPRPRPGEDAPEPDADGHLPISWMPRPAIACANTIAPNMGIRTDSELTRTCREGVMELLLANHPLDCPICDQAGECMLQEFSVEHGKGQSRFREQKVKKPKNVKVGPRIRLDDERCIMCSRCIRFMDEVVDDPVLGFLDRGSHTVLTVYPGRELDNNYSLNTADICPVGALTSTDFRFQMRVWFMKEVKTIDVNCGTGCNITVHARQNQIYRITPRRNNAVNSDWLPDSHRLSFHWIHGEERLTDPLIRENDVHRIAGWNEILGRLAKSLTAFEASDIALVASARLNNEELFLARNLARHLGIGDVDVVPRLGEGDGHLISEDRNPNTSGAKLLLGLTDPGASLPLLRSDIAARKIKALVVLDEDLIEDAGFTAEDLKPLEMLAVTRALASPISEAAHFVLPSVSWAEKSGTMINTTGRLQRLNEVIDPVGQAKPTWEILRDLIGELGGGNGFYSSIDLFRTMSSEIPEFRGMSWGDIGDLGVSLWETEARIPLLERERERIRNREIVG